MKAVIFDLDGTLLNSLEDLADACNAALTGARYPSHPLDDYRKFVGNGIETLLRRALPPGEADRLGREAFTALVDAMRGIYGKAWNVKSAPYPGIPETLKALADRGIRLGVLSNKPHPWTEEIIRYYFPHIPFAEVRGAMPGVPPKPDPAAALAIAARLDLSPDECGFVGDSNVDIHTAVAAGMIPVGATWGFRDREELLTAGAQYLVHTAPDLLQLPDQRSRFILGMQ
ncbi:MAG: HAD family hydrolase [Desulfovibrionaceae bacterium]|nr:HAD family hydrolase [Desulfovibrionaceae bacterium]